MFSYVFVFVCVCVCVCVQWNTRHGEVLSHSEFYVPAVSQVVNFVDDFFNWINPREHVNCVYTYKYLIFTQYYFPEVGNDFLYW